MRNQHFIAFGVTSEEKDEIYEYCRRKKRWKSPADLARDAVWQLMARNPVYRKNGKTGAQNDEA